MKQELKRIRKWVKKNNKIKNQNKEFRKKDEKWKHIDETVDKFNLMFEQLNEKRR